MGVLEQVMDLKKKGYPENDIISTLKEKGVPPKSINDALNQARIKTAVSKEGDTQEVSGGEEGMEPSIMRPERAESLPTEGGLSDEDLTPPFPTKFQTPKGPATMEVSEQEEYQPNSQGDFQKNSPYEYSQNDQQDSYQQGEEYQPQYSQTPEDTDTMIEISEQVFSEKMKNVLKILDGINEFKVLTETKVENISDRLRRMESIIDKLQSAILEKIGSYGSGLETVKKEMSMMQESFGKIVNTVADSTEHKRHSRLNTTHKKTSPTVHRIEKKTTVTHHSKNTSSKRKKSKR